MKEEQQQEDQYQNQQYEQNDKNKDLARDQPVGDKPEGTSEQDFEKFRERRQYERSQIDVDEGRLEKKK